MSTLISPDNTLALLAVLLFAAAFGIVGERKKWFGKISGVIVTIFATAILTTANVIPSAASPDVEVPLYDWIFKYVVALSIPLILFNVGLRRIVRESGRLLGAFLIGALGICIGVCVAFWLLPLGPEGYKVAAVYAATYIGGSVNFVAVADAMRFLDSPLFPATIAIDNMFTNFYLMLLFVLPSIKFLQRYFSKKTVIEHPPVPVSIEPSDKASTNSGYDMKLMEEITLALLISCVICAFGFWSGPYLAEWLGTDVKLDILIITLVVIVVSNVFPKQMAALEKVAFQIGFFLIFIFLAAIGAASDIKEIISSTPILLLFVFITLTVHLVVLLIGCKLLNISLEEIAIASSANVGGSTVAAPMAVSFEMKEAITPAIVIGIVGTVIGTFLGVGVGLLLQ